MNYLKKDPELGKTPDDRLELIKSGGLVIKTTIDLREQVAADKRGRGPRLPERAGDRRAGRRPARHR